MAKHRSLGVTVARVMTDNGSCYKSFVFRDACCDLGLAPNEGLVIANLTAMGAAGVVRLNVNMEFAVAGAFQESKTMALQFHPKIEDFVDLLRVYPTMAEAERVAAIERTKDS